MARFNFHQFPCRSDNYGVLVHDPDSGQCASIDAPDEQAVLDALTAKGWNLTHILVTHWHMDHVEGIAGLKSKFGCKVIGPVKEAAKIADLDETVDDGDNIEFAGEKVDIIGTPGHTLGMINFHFTQSGVVFTGDTLFALGCGRVFEGDGPMMWESLEKLSKLPEDTVVYCGHEYTLANGTFALTVDPDNEALNKRMAEIRAKRDNDEPTLPTTIGAELQTNPFLRVGDGEIRKLLSMEHATDAEVFTEIRARKDNS